MRSPFLVVLGAASTWAFPVSATLTAVVGVLVSGSRLALVIVATWLATRRVLRVRLRDALWREEAGATLLAG